jgi:predicted permease
VLAFTLAVSLATGMGCGLLPAWLRRAQPWQALRTADSPQSTAGRRALRLRAGLIAAQVALSFVLLIAAGLMVRSFVKLARVDAGFAHENVLTAELFPNWTAYGGTHDRIELFSRLLEALEDGPGVVSAAISTTAPFSGNGAGAEIFYFERRPPALGEAIEPAEGVDVEGNPMQGWPVRLVPIGISPDYFATLGIPILEGRMMNGDELAARVPAVLLSDAARRAYWPDSSPVGERIALRPVDSVIPDEWAWHTVVGVVADAKHDGLDRDPPPAFYSSYHSLGWGGRLLVRTSTDAQTMSAYIQQTVARIAPQQPVQNFRTYGGLRSASIAAPRLITLLMSLFAGLALLITVAGIGGVVAFAVGQQRHEIGIRMALGAARGTVLAMVLRQGVAMAVAGLGVGLVTALWFGNLVDSWLFETEPTDPLTFVAVAVILLAATVAASLLPARRATTIDPVVALRTD